MAGILWLQAARCLGLLQAVSPVFDLGDSLSSTPWMVRVRVEDDRHLLYTCAVIKVRSNA